MDIWLQGAQLFFWLLIGHAVSDFGLQSNWMARSKSRHATQPSSSSRHPNLIWIHVLTAHALIHGGAVALITGSTVLGAAEFFAHWIIDFGKSEHWYGFHIDQTLHVICKLLWTGLAIGVMHGTFTVAW